MKSTVISNNPLSFGVCCLFAYLFVLVDLQRIFNICLSQLQMYLLDVSNIKATAERKSAGSVFFNL